MRSGPYFVIVRVRGVICAGWFHLTRKGADERAAEHEGSQVIDLAKLLILYTALQEAEIEELERMYVDGSPQ